MRKFISVTLGRGLRVLGVEIPSGKKSGGRVDQSRGGGWRLWARVRTAQRVHLRRRPAAIISSRSSRKRGDVNDYFCGEPFNEHETIPDFIVVPPTLMRASEPPRKPMPSPELENRFGAGLFVASLVAQLTTLGPPDKPTAAEVRRIEHNALLCHRVSATLPSVPSIASRFWGRDGSGSGRSVDLSRGIFPLTSARPVEP